MDEVTRQVEQMYAKFPYPSPQGRSRNLKELRNLLKIFSIETGYDLSSKTVLDAGTGTGQRLIDAALAFKQTRFVAVDISEASLSVARKAAAHENLQNVQFAPANLMDDHNHLGTFDIILSMGVIHHLSDPVRGLRNLVRCLADDGIIFLYLYGKDGSQERMRRKRIISLLLNGNAKDFHQGIRLVKNLGFDNFDYGWNLSFDDEESRNSLIVDAYLNINETLFDSDGLIDLMKSSGLHAFTIYGITLNQHGCLFDTRYDPSPRAILETTDVAARLGPSFPRDLYERLSLTDKCRLMDLYFQPNGYTLMGFKSGALRYFSPGSRIAANMLTIAGP